MIPEKIAATLACPKCKSKPSIGKKVFCSQCRCSYSIKDDVPIMHIKTNKEKIEGEILRAKSACNLTSFSETITKEKEKNFLLSSQYGNTDEMKTLSSFIYKIGKRLYPPAVVSTCPGIKSSHPQKKKFTHK